MIHVVTCRGAGFALCLRCLHRGPVHRYFPLSHDQRVEAAGQAVVDAAEHALTCPREEITT